MNTRSLILATLLLIFGITACQDVINLTPESELTEANFYRTADDLERATLGAYNSYQSDYPRLWVLFETPTDHVHKSEYDFISGLQQIDDLAFHPSNGSFESFWNTRYEGIFRANAVLENLDTPTDLTADARARIEGEVRFLRALTYFDLVRAFGGVPNVTETLSIEEARQFPRSTEDETYELIISDLETALSLLPDRGAIEAGRADQGAAAALLGKVHVYRGNYATALEYFDDVDARGYALLENFDDVYSLENEDHDEGIFTLKYIQNDNGHRLSSDFLPYFGVAGYADLGDQIVDLSWELLERYDDEDARKEATITEQYDRPGTEGLEYRPYISKFMVSPMIGRNNNGSGLDLHVIRFAEIVLLRAEALYYEGDTDGAVEQINLIRERAFGNSDHNYTAADIASEEDFVDIILEERSLELALENERWPDLVRFDRLDILADYQRTENLVSNLNPQPHHRYFPIPAREMRESDALTQNDGYN